MKATLIDEHVLAYLAEHAPQHWQDGASSKPRLSYVSFRVVQCKARGLSTADTVKFLADEYGLQVTDRGVRAAYEEFLASLPDDERQRLTPSRRLHRVLDRNRCDIGQTFDFDLPGPD